MILAFDKKYALDTKWIDDLTEEEEKVLAKNHALFCPCKNKKIKIGILEDIKVEE